jgi:hypothetical protein
MEDWHEMGPPHSERGRLARLGCPARDGHFIRGGGASGAMEDCGVIAADPTSGCSNGRTAADPTNGCSNGRRAAFRRLA